MDIRSFAFDNEVSLVVYDPAVVRALEAIQARLFTGSREVTHAEWRCRSRAARVVENTARLADSLL